MFTVYKITNKINNKCYIGSTIRGEKRWKEHINCSQNPHDKKYNYPLYQAFRKYGVNNFSFEVLKDDFDSAQEMQSFEKEMILLFESHTSKGYNQTLETTNYGISSENLKKYLDKTKQKCAKVDINENILEIYESYHDAARKNGMDGDTRATSIRDVCKGRDSSLLGNIYRDLDENRKVISKPLKSYKNKKAIVGIKIDNPTEMIFFESVSEAARQLPADRGSLGKCISGSTKYSVVKGYIFRALDLNGNIIENEISIEDKIHEFNESNPMINGERHNITEWCKIYNISTNSFYERKKAGMSTIEAITLPKRR